MSITFQTDVFLAFAKSFIFRFWISSENFSISLFGSNGVTEDERNLGSETYFVNDGGTLSEVVYGSGQYAGSRFSQQK